MPFPIIFFTVSASQRSPHRFSGVTSLAATADSSSFAINAKRHLCIVELSAIMPSSCPSSTAACITSVSYLRRGSNSHGNSVCVLSHLSQRYIRCWYFTVSPVIVITGPRFLLPLTFMTLPHVGQRWPLVYGAFILFVRLLNFALFFAKIILLFGDAALRLYHMGMGYGGSAFSFFFLF